MKVLVTGGEGFIGKAIVKELLAAKNVDEIVVLDCLLPKIHGDRAKPMQYEDKRVRFVKGDVSVRNDIARLVLNTEAIIHLAAETGTGQSMYEIELYNKTNITGTALIMDVLTNNKHGVKKLVVASSRAVYGEGSYNCLEHGTVHPENRKASDLAKGDFEVKCPVCSKNCKPVATPEDALIHPSSFYGITKQFQEEMIMRMCPNIGISPVALRYQNVYGPGQSLSNPYTGVLSIFSGLFRAGKTVNIFEDGAESRDFVYVDDVAKATVNSLFEDGADGHVFNIGSGTMTPVIEVAKLLSSKLLSRSKISVTGDFRVGDIRHCFADISKAEKILGYRPSVSFDKGLSMFVDWVLDQAPGQDLYKRSIDEMKEKGLYSGQQEK